MIRLHARASLLGIVVCAISVLSGCAHQSVKSDGSPEALGALLDAACAPARDSSEVTGSIWLKASSPEASGQFPANVKATAPSSLVLEVTNLVGGTEAIIKVDGLKYSIQSTKKNVREQKGYGTWGGIPLVWATELFLGRIPCPRAADRALAAAPNGALEVRTKRDLSHPAERFVYTFRSWGSKPWPETLHWERLSSKGSVDVSVDFKFDDPEDGTSSPRKWEAKSSLGEVKVRWKDRQFTAAKG